MVPRNWDSNSRLGPNCSIFRLIGGSVQSCSIAASTRYVCQCVEHLSESGVLVRSLPVA